MSEQCPCVRLPRGKLRMSWRRATQYVFPWIHAPWVHPCAKTNSRSNIPRRRDLHGLAEARGPGTEAASNALESLVGSEDGGSPRLKARMRLLVGSLDIAMWSASELWHFINPGGLIIIVNCKVNFHGYCRGRVGSCREVVHVLIRCSRGFSEA